MDQDFLNQLNKPQKEAVLHSEGPLLIFAGAGSGKTRVLTYRVANLVVSNSVSPDNILAVTFTKKAAQEMTERIDEILLENTPEEPTRPQIGTFHSIAARILRMEGERLGYDRNFSIYDTDDSIGLVKELMLADNLDVKQFKPKSIYHMISSAKNDMVGPEEYSRSYAGFVEDIVGDIYPQYQKQLKDMNAMDFGDLLYQATLLLENEEEILKKYQNRFKYILVDEYQDTNTVQYRFVHNLAKEHSNLCVVGDDDQSIYKWRGADITNIISFEKDFDDVKIVKLEQNYRSVGNIIEAAVSVINQNNERVDKKLWTDKEQGEKITVYQARDEKGEAQFVVDEILNLTRNHHYDLGDFAVLYRTNYQSRVIEEAFLKRGVPYKLVGGYRFYDRKEIKDILSYLRAVNNLKDDVSLFRVINTPSRGIGPKTISKIVKLAKSASVTVTEMLIIAYMLDMGDLDPIEYGFEQSKVDAVDSVLGDVLKYQTVVKLFGSIYEQSRKVEVDQLIKLVLKKTKYVEDFDDGSDKAESRKENIEELKNVALNYSKKYQDSSLNRFLQDIALIEEEQNKNKGDASAGAVTLMTLHSSKGLEFPGVFMVGMEEGLLPHSRTFTEPAELEEERRLCYVGITRAKKRLWMTFAETRSRRGGLSDQMPSRFLGEIPQELCDYYSWSV